MTWKLSSLLVEFGIPVGALFILRDGDGELFVTKLALIPMLLLAVLIFKTLSKITNKEVAHVVLFAGLGYLFVIVGDLSNQMAILFGIIAGSSAVAIPIKMKSENVQEAEL